MSCRVAHHAAVFHGSLFRYFYTAASSSDSKHRLLREFRKAVDEPGASGSSAKPSFSRKAVSAGKVTFFIAEA
ncbi:MAG: hypothetical protein QW057_06405, partial [Candidatus Bathyarchaeia archaeon]